MTAIPRRVAIAVNRSRNLAVGMAATVRRKAFPRWPRPMVSRPVMRASAKLRFSTAIAEHRCCCADPQPPPGLQYDASACSRTTLSHQPPTNHRAPKRATHYHR